jgi:hypothetical protein
MAIWRIQYQDRYRKSRSIYHSSMLPPTKDEAIEIIQRDLQEALYTGSRQSAGQIAAAELAGITVLGVEDARV